MYRAVTWLALQKRVDLSDNSAVERLLADSSLEAGIEAGQSCFRVEGVDPAEALVSPEVNAAVSKIATLPCVRTLLVEMQRQYGLRCHSVMEGRDIGSVVFPETPAKFYVDASVEVRAARRLGQGLNDPVALRDAMDSARKSSPLMVPAGAWVIDSSEMSVPEVVAEMLRLLEPLGILPLPA
jgi:cytidylate kinase